VTEPEEVALATAFKNKSLLKWQEAKKLRDDPVLNELERAAQEARRKRSSSCSSSLSSSIGPDCESPTAFRQRSQQSWRKQHQELVNEAAHIGEGKGATCGENGNSETSLAEKLLRRGYGLGSSQAKADTTKSSATSDASADAKSERVAESLESASRTRLVKFYTKYNPAKLDAVDRTLAMLD